MKARTRACAISKSVQETVYKRDGGRCIFCGMPGRPEAHYIPRSQGGLGIEQNIITVCRNCHNKMDQSTERRAFLKRAKEHLDIWYPNFSDEERKFKKRRN